MSMWRPEVEQWLASEQTAENATEESASEEHSWEGEGLDEAAAKAFALVFQALPRLEPGSALTDRVVRAVQRAERRRRLTHRLGLVAALLLVTLAGVAMGYGAIGYAGGWLPKAIGAVTVPGLLGVITVMRAGVTAWLMVAGIGTALGTALATPESAAALLGMGLLGISALFALGRLLPGGPGTVTSVEART
jgi:hypothetical protein